jgi:uncharacterized protein (DUF885 family)
MKKSAFWGLVAVSAIVGFFVFYEPPESIAPPLYETTDTGPEDARVNAFFQEFIDREIAESPMFQTTLGFKTADQGKWDDISDMAALEDIEQRKADLARLRSEYARPAMSETVQLSYDLFVYNAEQKIRNHAFRRHSYVVDQFRGQVTDMIAFLRNNHRIETVADAEDYISRIAGLEDVLREMTRQLSDRAEFGVVTPAFSFPDMITDISAIGTGAPIDSSERANALYADFTAKVEALEIAETQREDLRKRAAEAVKGPYKRGVDGIVAEITRLQGLATGNRGVWALPGGAAFYKNRIRNHTTLDLSAIEIHKIGLADVARIHDEMRGVMETVGFAGSLQDFFAFVRTDPNNFYEDSDAGRAEFLAEARAQTDDIYAVVDQYFNLLPKARLEIRRVEPWRENSTSIAFYNSPSLDGSRPGIYYANMKDMANFQKYVFTAITYHEAVPGHHFQIALAQELEGIPLFRKLAGYGAYTEGWALYAERLPKEMGFYSDPMRDFGRLQDEIWRSVRLVVDTGIHHKKWTRDQAIVYFTENTPISEGDIVTEVERYFVNPGQALGYKMGMIKILELRARTREALGEAFDIREFHDLVIGTGALPLPILERQVEKYIAGKEGGG